MKKRALFAAGLIAFGAATFSACKDDDLSYLETDNLYIIDTTTEDIVEPVRIVSIEEAQQQLENILSEMDGSLSKKGKPVKYASQFTLSSGKRHLSKRGGGVDSVNAQVHVFNFENEEGFALMSATTATPALLALTEYGNIDTTQEIDNVGLIVFLERLEDYLISKNDTIIEYIDNENQSLSKKYKKTTTYDYYSPKGGFCKVHWDQIDPYNRYCSYKTNGDTYTGCVATATAQLLSTYLHPETYKGYIYNWNNMINGYDYDKVARLMQQLGLPENLDMKYGDMSKGEGSSSTIDKIPPTLKNLGFSNGGNVIDYNIDKIIEELKKGNCVVSSGYAHIKKPSLSVLGIKVRKTTYKSGHDWLIHGAFTLTTKIHATHSTQKNTTTIDNYVLCNWGWSGSYDGYYLSGVFDTNEGSKYNENYYSKKLSKNAEADHYYQYKLKILVNVKK